LRWTKKKTEEEVDDEPGQREKVGENVRFDISTGKTALSVQAPGEPTRFTRSEWRFYRD